VLFIPILTITGNRGGIPPTPPLGSKFLALCKSIVYFLRVEN